MMRRAVAVLAAGGLCAILVSTASALISDPPPRLPGTACGVTRGAPWQLLTADGGGAKKLRSGNYYFVSASRLKGSPRELCTAAKALPAALTGPVIRERLAVFSTQSTTVKGPRPYWRETTCVLAGRSRLQPKSAPLISCQGQRATGGEEAVDICAALDRVTTKQGPLYGQSCAAPAPATTAPATTTPVTTTQAATTSVPTPTVTTTSTSTTPPPAGPEPATLSVTSGCPINTAAKPLAGGSTFEMTGTLIGDDGTGADQPEALVVSQTNGDGDLEPTPDQDFSTNTDGSFTITVTAAASASGTAAGDDLTISHPADGALQAASYSCTPFFVN